MTRPANRHTGSPGWSAIRSPIPPRRPSSSMPATGRASSPGAASRAARRCRPARTRWPPTCSTAPPGSAAARSAAAVGDQHHAPASRPADPGAGPGHPQGPADRGQAEEPALRPRRPPPASCGWRPNARATFPACATARCCSWPPPRRGRRRARRPGDRDAAGSDGRAGGCRPAVRAGARCRARPLHAAGVELQLRTRTDEAVPSRTVTLTRAMTRLLPGAGAGGVAAQLGDGVRAGVPQGRPLGQRRTRTARARRLAPHPGPPHGDAAPDIRKKRAR